MGKKITRMAWACPTPNAKDRRYKYNLYDIIHKGYIMSGTAQNFEQYLDSCSIDLEEDQDTFSLLIKYGEEILGYGRRETLYLPIDDLAGRYYDKHLRNTRVHYYEFMQSIIVLDNGAYYSLDYKGNFVGTIDKYQSIEDMYLTLWGLLGQRSIILREYAHYKKAQEAMNKKSFFIHFLRKNYRR